MKNFFFIMSIIGTSCQLKTINKMFSTKQSSKHKSYINVESGNFNNGNMKSNGQNEKDDIYEHFDIDPDFGLDNTDFDVDTDFNNWADSTFNSKSRDNNGLKDFLSKFGFKNFNDDDLSNFLSDYNNFFGNNEPNNSNAKVDNNNISIQECYRVLGLNEDAKPIEIKKAYKNLAKKYHPDKNPGNKEATKFIQILEAYSNLKENLKF